MIILRKEIALPLIAIIILVLSIIENRTECYYCWFLIVLYLFIYWGKIGLYKYLDSTCAFFIAFLTFVRYLIIPLLIILDNEYMTYSPLGLGMNENYFYKGFYLTVWELLLFGLFINRKLPKWYYNNTNNAYIKWSKTHFTTWIILITGLLGLLYINPSILQDYSFVINLKPDETIAQEYIPKGLTETISTIASRVLKIVIPIPIVSLFYKRYNQNHSIANFYISIIVLAFFYAFIIEGNSRNTIIIPAVAVLFILLRLYPQYRKTILSTLVTVILLIAILSLIWKSFAGDFSTAKESSFSYWISYIESYFAGFSNMGKAVSAYQNSDIFMNPIIAFNDLARNVPFLNSLVDNTNTASYYYVMTWGRSDQVIPATGNGLFYFSYILAPVVSMMILCLGHYFEKRMHNSTSVPEYIIYCYSSIVISYNMFNSVSTMMMKLSITLLPLLFVLYLSKKMNQISYNHI